MGTCSKPWAKNMKTGSQRAATFPRVEVLVWPQRVARLTSQLQRIAFSTQAARRQANGPIPIASFFWQGSIWRTKNSG